MVPEDKYNMYIHLMNGIAGALIESLLLLLHNIFAPSLVNVFFDRTRVTQTHPSLPQRNVILLAHVN